MNEAQDLFVCITVGKDRICVSSNETGYMSISVASEQSRIDIRFMSVVADGVNTRIFILLRIMFVV
jgi:hypothetical protein